MSGLSPKRKRHGRRLSERPLCSSRYDVQVLLAGILYHITKSVSFVLLGITRGRGSVSVAAGRTCRLARALLPGLALYDALSLAPGAREAALEAPAVVRAPWLLDLGGQAGLLEVGLNGVALG